MPAIVSLLSPALRVPLLLMPMPVPAAFFNSLVPVPIILSFAQSVLITPRFKISISIATDAFESCATNVANSCFPTNTGTNGGIDLVAPNLGAVFLESK
ncbi:MAG: hypothetical protein V7L20_22125 [Nostoc sp.]